MKDFKITLDNTDGTYSTSLEADGASPEFAILYGLAYALSDTETLDVELKLVKRAAEYMMELDQEERLNAFFAAEMLPEKIQADFTLEITNSEDGFEYSLNTRGAPHIVPFMVEALLSDMTQSNEVTEIEREFLTLGTKLMLAEHKPCSH